MQSVSIWALSLWLAACATTGTAAPERTTPLPGVYTADGQVLGVERPLPQDRSTNVHLIFQAKGEEPVRVELGPGWYMDEGKLDFDAKDDVSVEGQRVSRHGNTVVVAKSVRKGSTQLQLRDAESQPLWPH
ncbi:MAG: hypothetical protein QM756_44390 [Polyangiaceae bacterium]